MKKLLALLLALAMVLSMVACGDTTTPETEPAADDKTPAADDAADAGDDAAALPLAGKTIEVATRLTDESLQSLRDLVAQFEAETGCDIELTEYPAEDYEAALKTRMSSNELPDVWETHGWSRLRYGEYLMPLNDMSWYDKQTDLAKGILVGDGDIAYGLMLDTSLLGIICNMTVLEPLGVDPLSWKTLDDFLAACQTCVDNGIVPCVTNRSGGDLTHMAGLWTTYPDAPYPAAEAQLDGTWDWEDNMVQLEWLAGMLEAGYFWDDLTTVDSNTNNERYANGQSAFYMANGSSFGKVCHDLNAECESIIVPFPAVEEGANPYIAGGEGYTVGIWNETEEVDACVAWLEFLVENGQPLTGAMSAIEGLESNYEDYGVQMALDLLDRMEGSNVVYVNMWDREYMPSGMWGVYGEAVNSIYADWSAENLATVNEFLKTNYNEKWLAANG